MVGRRSTYIGTVPVAGTGRINFASSFAGHERQVGDELYIIATANDESSVAVPTFGSTPAGWTKLDDQSGGTRTRHALFYKVSDGTEGNVDITATSAGSPAVAVAAIAISGGARNTGILGSGSMSSGTWNSPDVTTVEEFSHVFAFVGARSNGAYTTTDGIEHVDSSAGTTFSRVGIFEQMTKDPSTRDLEGTTTGTTTEVWAFVIVMEPTSPALTDTFTRTENPIASGWSDANGMFSGDIETNGTQAKAQSAGNCAAYLSHIFERDIEISATVATKGATSDIFSLFVRVNNPASGTFNAIELRYDVAAGTDTLRLFRWVSGSATQIGTTQNQEVNNGDKLKLKAIGTHYSIELDTGSGFTEIYAFDDTGSVVTRGWAAMRIFNTTFRIDDLVTDRIEREGHAEYVHAVTSGGSTTAATTANINLPIAYPGDIYLLHFHNFKTTGGNPTVTIPGFTQFGSQVNNGDHSHMIFYRVCDGTEGAVDTASIVVVATASSTQRWRCGAISVIGDADDPFATDPYGDNAEAASTTWATDSIAQAAGDLLVAWTAHQGTNTNTATNDDAAAVETQDSASNSSGTHIAVYIKRITTGTTDDATGTLSGSNAKTSFIYTVKAAPSPPTTDADTVTLTLTPSFSEEYSTPDSGTVYLTLTPTLGEEYTGATEYTDSGTVTLTLTPSGTEIAAFVETGEIYLDLTPSGTEIYATTYVDSGSIYLTFTPSGTEFVHTCKPRFRGTLLTWNHDIYYPFVAWTGTLRRVEWWAELAEVEQVVNYAC